MIATNKLEYSRMDARNSLTDFSRDLLLALGALAEAAPRVAEVDLNPVIVHQEGAGVSLIDARVRLSD
jgi:hypothetical protein